AGHFLEGTFHVFTRIVPVALEPVAIGFGHPAWGIQQTFTGGIFASPAQQGAYGLFGLCLGDGGVLGVGHYRQRLDYGVNMLPVGVCRGSTGPTKLLETEPQPVVLKTFLHLHVGGPLAFRWMPPAASSPVQCWRRRSGPGTRMQRFPGFYMRS